MLFLQIGLLFFSVGDIVARFQGVSQILRLLQELRSRKFFLLSFRPYSSASY
ncbi:hypothetical protein M758_9G162000 [Ceratodon purpureus]|uniref:Uncharacterized protein n=1 Tax=Ceratodon purpureus TaxID=3225 RepID=A0A8T0GRG4_CERPU|nr:hypothetical protein KC19_9G129900 [Ceratodon purpureus]KAG0606711.1 hypothetical protein M758_9G162000 [Ceratodon purpureus]